jgi:hypothetical protein
LNAAIPDANPIALERARQRTNNEGKGTIGLLSMGLLGGGGTRVSKDTKAASVKNPTGELSIVGSQ